MKLAAEGGKDIPGAIYREVVRLQPDKGGRGVRFPVEIRIRLVDEIAVGIKPQAVHGYGIDRLREVGHGAEVEDVLGSTEEVISRDFRFKSQCREKADEEYLVRLQVVAFLHGGIWKIVVPGNSRDAAKTVRRGRYPAGQQERPSSRRTRPSPRRSRA